MNQLEYKDMKCVLNPKKVYLAGGWFNKNQENIIMNLESILSNKGLYIFSPRLNQNKTLIEFSIPWRDYVFNQNHTMINNTDIMVAVYDEEDPGTMWEIGFAYSIGKPIILFSKVPTAINLMISDSLHAYLEGYSSVINYDFCTLPKIPYRGIVK